MVSGLQHLTFTQKTWCPFQERTQRGVGHDSFNSNSRASETLTWPLKATAHTQCILIRPAHTHK